MGRKKNRNQQSASKLPAVSVSGGDEAPPSKPDPEPHSEHESEDSWQVVTAAETKQSTSPVAKDTLPVVEAAPAPALSPAPSAAVSSSSSAQSGPSVLSSEPPSIAGDSLLDSRSPSVEAAPFADDQSRQHASSPVQLIPERSASTTSSTASRPRKIEVTAHSKKKSMSHLQPAKAPQLAQMTINRKKRAQELFANTADMAKQLFDVLDADGDGMLTRAELCTSMTQIDPAFNDTPDKADMIFSVCDPTHKGYIDMETFRSNFSFILNVQNAPAISLSASPTPSTMSTLSAPAGWTARHDPSPTPEPIIEPTLNVELTAEQQEKIGREIASLGLAGVDAGSFLLLKDKFDQFDSDKNGYMDKSEFAVMMRSHLVGEHAGDAPPTPAEEKAINELWNTMDTDGDGRISFKEFVQSYSGATESEPRPSSPTLRSPKTPTRGRPRGFSVQTLTPAQASALSKRSAAPVLVADASGSDSAPSTTRRLVPRGSQMTLKGVSTLSLFNRNFSSSQADLFAVPPARAPLSQASPYVAKRPSMSFLREKGYGTLPRDMLTRLTSQDSTSSLQTNSPRVVVSPVMSHRMASDTPTLSLNDEPSSTAPRLPKHTDDPKELFAWLDPDGNGSVSLKGLQLAMCHYIGRDLTADELSEVHKILAKKTRRATGTLSTFVSESGEHTRSHTTASELEADRVNLEEFMHVLQHFKQSASEDRNIVKSFQAAYGGGSVELEEELGRVLGELEEQTNLNKDLTLAKNKATARYEEMRDHAERLEQQNDALSKQVIELNTHKLRTQEKLDDLKRDLSKHEASVLRLTQQLEESNKSLQNWKEQATHSAEELRFSDERMAQLTDKLKAAGDQITALEGDREALKKMKQAEALRQQELDRLTDHERARLLELEETVNLLQEKDHEHTRMIADLQEHARQLEEERGKLRLALSTSLSNLEAGPSPFSPTLAPTSPPLLADAPRGHQRKPSRSVPLAALTGVPSAQQKEASLQAQLGELSAAENADRLAIEVSAARAQRDALLAEVHELSRSKLRAADEQAKGEALQAEHTRLQAAVAELSAQHSKVEADLKQAAQRLESAKKKLGHASSAEEAAAAAKQLQDRLAAELQQERSALAALRTDLEQARAAATKSQADSKTASAERDRLSRELEEERKNAARLKSELDKLKTLPAPAPSAEGPAPQRMVPTRRGSVEMENSYQSASAASQASGKSKLLTDGEDSSGHRRKNSMEFKEATCCAWLLSKPK